jgi:hypothetical protein
VSSESPEADRFDLLALVIADYERRQWAIEAPDAPDLLRTRMEQKGDYDAALEAIEAFFRDGAATRLSYRYKRILIIFVHVNCDIKNCPVISDKINRAAIIVLDVLWRAPEGLAGVGVPSP